MTFLEINGGFLCCFLYICCIYMHKYIFMFTKYNRCKKNIKHKYRFSFTILLQPGLIISNQYTIYKYMSKYNVAKVILL